METFEHNSLSEKRDDDFVFEILTMAQADQDVRKHWEETGEVWDLALEKKNAERLKEIIEKRGWPTQSKVGSEAANAAWLLVQHADHDPEFQQKCLDSMQQESEGEVRKQNIAFLEDRVRANTNRPTLYGTQFDYDSEGLFGPLPIEEREGLDRRREEMGLGPFEEYEKEMRQLNQRMEKTAGTKIDT